MTGLWRPIWAILVTLSAGQVWASHTAFAELLLTPAQIDQAQSFGPWPPPRLKDPSNHVSGVPEAIAFGQALFSSPVLSVNGTQACISCHRPEEAFAEPLATSQGFAPLDRNSQSVVNAAFNRWFGWDGSTDNLWAQSLHPIIDNAEMGHTPRSLKESLLKSDLRARYEAVFGDPAQDDPERLLVNVGKALSAYQETLVSGRSSFDQFRDQLADGDLTALTYPAAAQRGFQLFVGKGRCHFCHMGPHFTNGEFQDAGIPYLLPGNRVDSGRFGGLKALFDSPYTLAGPYSDDPDRSGAWATKAVRPNHADFGAFRVPSLRLAAKTAPFMHDGSLATLTDVVTHYNEIDMERMHTDGIAILEPLGLNQQEIDDLVAFLMSIGDGDIPQ